MNHSFLECVLNPVTTVVGSFPIKSLPIKEAIKWAVDLQLSHNIGMISDGEQRSDMTGYFQDLPGLERTQYGPCIASKVKSYEEIEQFTKIKDYEFVSNYLNVIGKDQNIPIKTTITGPITLGFSCAAMGIKSHYKDVRDIRIYEDFAEALRPLVEKLLSMGSRVQIDEPSLSTRVMEESKAIRMINSILLDGLKMRDRLSVHICGAMNPSLLEKILRINVPVISMAFSGPDEGKNVELISKKLFEENDKKLGIGCISVAAMKEHDVETTEIVTERLNNIESRVGLDNIAYLHPNCGLGSTKEELVFKILESMTNSINHWFSLKNKR